MNKVQKYLIQDKITSNLPQSLLKPSTLFYASMYDAGAHVDVEIVTC